MNKRELDILNKLHIEPFINQRILAESTGYSLGMINKAIKSLSHLGYIDESLKLTNKAKDLIISKSPRRAVILAAGFGMRMVPINTEIPKGLIEVDGEPLIERVIKFLHQTGIREIYIVVGFLKEHYEYLIDEYNVELVVNEEYASKNNLHSMKLVKDYLMNAYIIPCDIWCERNPFSATELYSWYMVSDLVDDDSMVRVNRKMELCQISTHAGGNAMVGISYLTASDGTAIADRITQLCSDPRNDNAFWEDALYDNGKMTVCAKVVHSSEVVEINTYEQLRELDEDSRQLKSDAIQVITETLDIEADDITDITVLKKGMTNRSFLFRCGSKKYIMRIPGEGTDQLINRRQEAEVYRVINGNKICDDIVYINPENGYKITEFLEGSKVCDLQSDENLQQCMNKLRWFHNLELKVNHEFDIFGQIDFYKSLWNGKKSVYRDHDKTTDKVKRLKKYIDIYGQKRVLTHIDAVPDNFLFTVDGEIRLIDWEYAGMQDPHVDIAMFCIYSFYERKQVDHLINLYFTEGCPDEVRIKIYCYIAACGLLWSNWCEYKRQLGVEFGEYSIRQYRYAKDYYKIVCEELEKKGEFL